MAAQHRKHLPPCAEIQTRHKSPTVATQSYFNGETVSALLTSSATLPAIIMVHAATQRQQRPATATVAVATDPRFVFHHVDRVILNRFVRTSDTKQPCLSEASQRTRVRAAVATIGEPRGRKSSVNAQQCGALYAMYNRQQLASSERLATSGERFPRAYGQLTTALPHCGTARTRLRLLQSGRVTNARRAYISPH
ncbi:hypothetical protein K0M31_013061 [Melipona bicolor]|uniref:Uncharacterized protein n=1 Tax=Melipona bicolor TaxID=60889 RepID=A0AA40FIH2_9HYME|nr:hypothetical protein K0M31_013061 [Melipona bicolor]